MPCEYIKCRYHGTPVCPQRKAALNQCFDSENEAQKPEAVKSNSTDLLNDNKVLRELLWLNHGCPQNNLYGDDGERQCNRWGCMIDFKRDTVDVIRKKLGGI